MSEVPKFRSLQIFGGYGYPNPMGQMMIYPPTIFCLDEEGRLWGQVIASKEGFKQLHPEPVNPDNVTPLKPA